MKKIIFIVAFGLSLTQLHAQDSISASKNLLPKCKWQKGVIGLMVGFFSESPYHSKYNPNPENRFLKSGQQQLPYNKKDFNVNNYYGGGAFINPYISFNPWSKKTNSFNKNHELRIGAIYYMNTGRDINYYNKYDAGSRGDTTLMTHVTFNNLRDDLGMNIGYVVSSNQWRRFSMYSGVDLGIAYSITHRVLQKVTETTYDSISANSGYYTYRYNTSYSNDQYKELKANPSISVRGNIVAGMNLRIVNPVILFTEGRIGYSYIQPLSEVASMQAHFNINIGFKFSI